jgi:hypothetical protein
MTGKQMLDAFSETLMQDERILAPRERELLLNILQSARAISGSTPEVQAAVTNTIARSVGETVAQRAFSLLGGSIVEQILAHSGITTSKEDSISETRFDLGSPASPQPPTGPSSPQPPTSSPQPPTSSPQGSPQPPTHSVGTSSVRGEQRTVSLSKRDATAVGLLEPPDLTRAKCVVLDEFLTPQEVEELMQFTLRHETDFQTSGVISPTGEPGMIDYSHRRSRLLMDLEGHEHVMLERIRGVLPSVLDRLGEEEFPVSRVEAQITASNDGDFFGAHCDDGQETIASRKITFVYFFHREPRPFEGGELRLHDTRSAGGRLIKAGCYQSISPLQNQIVFFPCSLMHEITPVKCLSKAFADSRFTLNGWLHK